MVKVAKDHERYGRELPSEAARELVTGISLESVLVLPSAAGAEVCATPEQLQAVVARASVLDGGPVASVPHHLVCADHAVLADLSRDGREPLRELAAAGASAVAVAGAAPENRQRWRETAQA